MDNLLNIHEAHKDQYPQARQRLIQILRKNGKIPTSVYLKYESEKGSVQDTIPIDQKFDRLLIGLISSVSAQAHIDNSQVDFCFQTWENILKEKGIMLVQGSDSKLELVTNKPDVDIKSDKEYAAQVVALILTTSASMPNVYSRMLYLFETCQNVTAAIIPALECEFLGCIGRKQTQKMVHILPVLFSLKNVPVYSSSQTIFKTHYLVSLVDR